MTSDGAADIRNVTGVWQGLYTYPGGSPSVSFIADLTEIAGMLSGITREGDVLDGSPGESIAATLIGSLRAGSTARAHTRKETVRA